MDILKGQRFPLTQLCSNSNFQIGLQASGTKEAIDFACFGLDAQQKLSDDSYMTFFNQPKTPCGAIELSIPMGDSAGFLCNLNKLPLTIDRLVFTAAIDGSETMRQIQTGYLRFLGAGQETARFSFSGADFQNEKALMLGELYRKDGAWRFSAVGQGFNGGLDALVKHFGGEVIEKKTDITPPPTPITKPAVDLQKVSGKIKLSKGQSPIVIEKTPEITASISWQTGTDYDVYALIYTKDGRQVDVATFGATGVPALRSFGNGAVEHMGDVGRSGGSVKTETIKIRLNDNILAVIPVAYSAQSNGTGSFHHYKVSMLIENHRGTTVTISAKNANTNNTIYTCVPGIILNKPHGIVIDPVEYYSKPRSENRPKLAMDTDGNIKIVMDAGPINDYK